MRKIFIVLIVLFGCKGGSSSEYGLSKSQVAAIITSIEADLTRLESYVTKDLVDASALTAEITSGGGTGSEQNTTRMVMILRKRINDNLSKLETLYIPPDAELDLEKVLTKFKSINEKIPKAKVNNLGAIGSKGQQSQTLPDPPATPKILGYLRSGEIGSSISGIDFSSDRDHIFAVSDVSAKIYEYAFQLQPFGLKVVKEFDVVVPHLKDDKNKSSGFESIRIKGNQVFITAEIESGKTNSVLYQGKLTEEKIELKKIKTDYCFPTDFDVNGGIEGLSMSAGGNIWIINERPFLKDKQLGRLVRLTEIDEKGKTTRQFIYELKDDPQFVADGNEYTNGVSEIFAVSSSEMYVMERGHNMKTCKTYVNIFKVNTDEAGKALKDCKSISRSNALTKMPVYSLEDTYADGKKVDNFEGMCTDHKGTLLLISDNNESNGAGTCPQQFTEVIAVQLE